jgi:pSer/pThr/pTyr-binding forkhead associated (FHA) protein
MEEGFELAVIKGEAVAHAVPLIGRPLEIGRAPTSDLVVGDESVSWRHAQVWLEGRRPWLRDLASRNGTFLNESRVRRPAPLADGDKIRVGNTQVLQVRAAASPVVTTVLQLEDVGSNVAIPLRSDRFHIGSGSDAHLRLPDGPARAATLLIHDGGEMWLGTEEGDRQLTLEESFEVGGRTLRLIEAHLEHAPTVESGKHRYPYRMTAKASGPTGPQATLKDPDRQLDCLLTGNRGVLMYLLAKKLSDDRKAGLSAAEEGWCSDSDLAIGIWGRGGKEANHLHVLVYRLRKHLTQQGFDPWFLEKRRWGLRARLHRVRVT